MRFVGAASKGIAVMHMIAALLLALTAAGPLAAEGSPLRLVRTISLPGVDGRIDHLAIDLDRQQLYIAELGNDTLGVVDLIAGKQTKKIAGLSEPQGVLFVAGADRVVVTNGGSGSVDIFDGESLARVGRINLAGDADNVRYDATAKAVYAGYGNGALAVLDIEANGAQSRDIPLAAHPESFQLERQGPRIFINVPRTGEVAVVDRSLRKVVARWPLSRAGANFPMALDEAHHRLFVGTRQPSALIVLDTETGKETARTEICADADDLFYDEARTSLYLACGEGTIDVLSAREGDRYGRTARIPTVPGARTGLFVPEQDRLYLALPRQGLQPAELRVYEVGPVQTRP